MKMSDKCTIPRKNISDEIRLYLFKIIALLNNSLFIITWVIGGS